MLRVVGIHFFLFAAALLSAFLLAYNFRWAANRELQIYWFIDYYLPLLVMAIPLKTFAFYWMRQYHGSWRYVGLRDLFGLISASLVGSFFFLSVYFVIEQTWNTMYGSGLIDNWPHQNLKQSSVFALDFLSTVIFVTAARVLVRFYYEDIQPGHAVNPTRVLICGAGDTGEALVRELHRMREDRYDCVGFLDDDVPQLYGRIHDVEILGRSDKIREICEKFDIEEVLIALPQATPRMIRHFVEQCEGTGVRFRTIPAVSDVIEGRVKVSQIRDVDIADLLGRETVELDNNIIGVELKNKCVLVTGAGGSIGSEMCRQIATFKPEKLILIERGENNLFEVDRALRKSHPEFKIIPYVADITDILRMQKIFEKHQPTIVFHAAAHKHVPMMEINPGESIKNNIAGTMTVADVASQFGVEKMVMISTDKAVRPTSMMGCTKRVAEMYVQGLTSTNNTLYVTVRFGNVLGSSGSVVPIFQKQIADGGPVTVTHKDMTRYFMTITEAAQLVLQAGAMGKGGEIYVLDMGDPVKIIDLARDMITLSGLKPGTDIEIEFTGIRPGEKLYEELSNEGEDIGDTAHPKIGIWKHRPTVFETLKQSIDRLLAMADTAAENEIKVELQQIVPDYQPEGDVNSANQSDQTEYPSAIPSSISQDP